MSARCKTCGAPVNLAPDGDPKYERPRIYGRILAPGELDPETLRAGIKAIEAEIADAQGGTGRGPVHVFDTVAILRRMLSNAIRTLGGNDG